jgi:hypothetical protein
MNGIFYLAVSGPLGSIAWSWQFVMCGFAGCRLILHLHSSAATVNGKPSFPPLTNPFGSPPGNDDDGTDVHDGYVLTTYFPPDGECV